MSQVRISLLLSVSSFHNQQQSTMSSSSQCKETCQELDAGSDMEVCDSSQMLVPLAQPEAAGADCLLLSGRILLVHSSNYNSLNLPKGFWDDENLTKFMPFLAHQIEHDFNW